jgi:hypothetical protein
MADRILRLTRLEPRQATHRVPVKYFAELIDATTVGVLLCFQKPSFVLLRKLSTLPEWPALRLLELDRHAAIDEAACEGYAAEVVMIRVRAAERHDPPQRYDCLSKGAH